MYAVYTYAAATTQANLVADVIKLLTGETNKSNLSSDCVQASTTITSTVAAGWAVYDSAAGSNEQCIRVLNQDGVTYKYYNFLASSTTVISGKISEAWNAGAHTGTNTSATLSSVWSSTGGGVLYIYATAKNIVIQSYSSATFQTLVGMCLFEMSRDSIPSGYPCAALLNTANTGFCQGSSALTIPRLKSANAAGDTANSTNIAGGPLTVSTNNGSPTTATHVYRTSGEVQTLPFYKLGFGGSAAAAGFHYYGAAYDVYIGSHTNYANLDEIAYNGVIYVAIKGSASTFALLVPKQ